MTSPGNVPPERRRSVSVRVKHMSVGELVRVYWPIAVFLLSLLVGMIFWASWVANTLQKIDNSLAQANARIDWHTHDPETGAVVYHVPPRGSFRPSVAPIPQPR